jgi:hypothetical protein
LTAGKRADAVSPDSRHNALPSEVEDSGRRIM